MKSETTRIVAAADPEDGREAQPGRRQRPSSMPAPWCSSSNGCKTMTALPPCSNLGSAYNQVHETRS